MESDSIQWAGQQSNAEAEKSARQRTNINIVWKIIW